jgi:hypothetical protein
MVGARKKGCGSLMSAPGNQARIRLCTGPTNIRKSFNKLCTMARNPLGSIAFSGQNFVFVNRRKTRMSVPCFEPSDFCLWSKCLAYIPKDPDVPLDTHHLVRTLRPIPMVGKVWLFCRAEPDAEQ